MTLPALISRLSGRAAPFVTLDGRLLPAADVVSTGVGHHHPDWGTVTKVQPMQHHGGQPERPSTVEPWWVHDPELLEAEAAAVSSQFPGFVRTTVHGVPGWVGKINTGRGVFEVTVLHRNDRGLPSVIPTSPALFRRPEGRKHRRSPHLFDNGNLCVARADDWDSAEHDATVVIAWAAHWLATFTTWRITGRGWPSNGVLPDVA